MTGPHVRLDLLDTIDLPGPTTPDLYAAACDNAALWRAVAIRLALHVRRIEAAGDAASRAAKLDHGRVCMAPESWRALRGAAMSARVELAQIERATGERLV